MSSRAQFGVGQIVKHVLLEYVGVVVDVDAEFSGTDDWYDRMARTRPPKDAPWYHVLVEDADHMTYVAERNLTSLDEVRPIRHPMLNEYFRDFRDGGYVAREALN
ncbi:MAG: heat shock protein HspQ [Proteobacteria bacterium]|nr:heat shock protein HspQ [Pseudomonadota bacterium]